MNRTRIATSLVILFCASGLLLLQADPGAPPANTVSVTGVPTSVSASGGHVVQGVASSTDPEAGLVEVRFAIEGEPVRPADLEPSPESDAVNPFSIPITPDMAGKILVITAIDADGCVKRVRITITA